MPTKSKPYTEKDLAKDIAKLPSASFKNEHGEEFFIHSSGVRNFMSGDEVREMVSDEHKIDGKYVELFPHYFSIWSTDEIRKLGKALQEVADEVDRVANS